MFIPPWCPAGWLAGRVRRGRLLRLSSILALSAIGVLSQTLLTRDTNNYLMLCLGLGLWGTSQVGLCTPNSGTMAIPVGRHKCIMSKSQAYHPACFHCRCSLAQAPRHTSRHCRLPDVRRTHLEFAIHVCASNVSGMCCPCRPMPQCWTASSQTL